jgi:hypothetical protein
MSNGVNLEVITRIMDIQALGPGFNQLDFTKSQTRNIESDNALIRTIDEGYSGLSYRYIIIFF